MRIPRVSQRRARGEWLDRRYAGFDSFVFRLAAARRRRSMSERGRLREQLLRGESQSIDGCKNLRPSVVQKAFAFAGQQKPPGALAHVHAAAAALLDQAFIHELL